MTTKPTNPVNPKVKSEEESATQIEPVVPQTAEEIFSDSQELQNKVQEYGSSAILKVLKTVGQEKSLKPYQAELILVAWATGFAATGIWWVWV